MTASASFGWECKRDRIRIGLIAHVSVGGQSGPPICETCGQPMTPVAPGSDAPDMLTNVTCGNCNSFFGTIVSVGGQIAECPNCHKPL